MYCNNCGQQLQAGQQFCSSCGAAVPGGGVVAPRAAPDMQYHLRVLGILWIAWSSIAAVGGAVLLIVANTLFGPWGLRHHVNDAPGFLHPLLSFLGILILLKGVAGLAAGVGLLQHQPWARPLAIIVACVALISIPFGTALAIYTFWVLLSSNAEERYQALAMRA
jgi:zinc-ribbon domain